jgi:hypothetical protein
LLFLWKVNGKVGSENVGYESCMAQEVVEMITGSGLENDLLIGDTTFLHKTIRKLTYLSQDRRINNQIDHVTIELEMDKADGEGQDHERSECRWRPLHCLCFVNLS